jgi:hypothetical protein
VFYSSPELQNLVLNRDYLFIKLRNKHTALVRGLNPVLPFTYLKSSKYSGI